LRKYLAEAEATQAEQEGSAFLLKCVRDNLLRGAFDRSSGRGGQDQSGVHYTMPLQKSLTPESRAG
jgi:hypothetical protein